MRNRFYLKYFEFNLILMCDDDVLDCVCLYGLVKRAYVHFYS